MATSYRILLFKVIIACLVSWPSGDSPYNSEVLGSIKLLSLLSMFHKEDGVDLALEAAKDLVDATHCEASSAEQTPPSIDWSAKEERRLKLKYVCRCLASESRLADGFTS